MNNFRVLQLDHVGMFVPDSVVDHDTAYSVYFSDPYGHRLEITSYDHDVLRKTLAQVRDQAR